MIKFKHLLYTECPTCSSNIKSFSYYGKHTNGEQFEDMEFMCGFSVSWTPSFSRELHKRLCRNSDAEKQLKIRQNKFVDDMLETLYKYVEKDTSDTYANFASYISSCAQYLVK